MAASSATWWQLEAIIKCQFRRLSSARTAAAVLAAFTTRLSAPGTLCIFRKQCLNDAGEMSSLLAATSCRVTYANVGLGEHAAQKEAPRGILSTLRIAGGS